MGEDRLSGHKKLDWPQELASFGDRDIRWCYNFFHGKPSSENFAVKKNNLALFFERTIKNNETINLDEIEHLLGFDKIMALRNSNVMDLSWIQKNDHRLLVWLERRGLPEMGSMMLITDLTRLSYSTAFLSAFRNSPPKIPADRRYDLIIEYIDSIRFYTHDPQEKQKVLDTIKEMWLRDRTLDRPVKWLDPSDEKQLLWAWDYLRNRSRAAPIKEPLTPEEQYGAILASLDLTEVFNRERFENIDKKEFILKFRKAWYQKDYRRLEKVKKPYHLPLSTGSARMLSELAAVENQKAVKLLERLIETEYNKVCLDENGKRKHPRLP